MKRLWGGRKLFWDSSWVKGSVFHTLKKLREWANFHNHWAPKRINRGKIEIGEKYRMKCCEEAGSFFEALLEWKRSVAWHMHHIIKNFNLGPHYAFTTYLLPFKISKLFRWVRRLTIFGTNYSWFSYRYMGFKSFLTKHLNTHVYLLS